MFLFSVNRNNRPRIPSSPFSNFYNVYYIYQLVFFSFHTLYFSEEVQLTSNTRGSLSTLSLHKAGSLNIEIKKDTRDSDITALAVNYDGKVLIADYHNKNIKSVSPDGTVELGLFLPEHPRAITFWNPITAIVAGAFDKKLYRIDTTDLKSMSLMRQYQLDYGVYDMTHFNGELAITCDSDPVCIRMITLDDMEVVKIKNLWTVDNVSGENLLSSPYGITTTTHNNTAIIVVTDCSTNTLNLLEAETGKVIRILDVPGKFPQGITTDKDGNVYVCYTATREICVWSSGFEESKILLSGDMLGEEPQNIVYNGVNNSLYVSYKSCNSIDCFQLK